MDKIDHLSVSKVNYSNCVYSLAARDYNKAASWISSAIAHVKLYIEQNRTLNLTKIYTRLHEYEKLQRAIAGGGKTPLSDLFSALSNSEPIGEPAAEQPVSEPKQIEQLTFDDVVGLDNVKETVRGAIVYPFKYGDIYRAFKRKSGGGILLYGAPGTGKTMIAKAIAGEIDAKFISVNCSDIYSKWLGESQQNIKRLFDRARKAERAVIFFDEFEALGCSRNGESGDANGVNGVVCELLAQIDGFCTDAHSTVLVIAATNRPWDVDSALLRSGRFERHLYIDMPDEWARAEIIKKAMNELPIEQLCYDELGQRTDGFSAADVAEACNRVKDRAIMRSIQENGISKITQWDFIDAISAMHPTVNRAELKRLELFV